MRLHCPKSWVGGARSSGIVDCLQRRGLHHRQRSSDALRRTMLIFLIEEVFSTSRQILLSDVSTFLLCIAFVYKKWTASFFFKKNDNFLKNLCRKSCDSCGLRGGDPTLLIMSCEMVKVLSKTFLGQTGSSPPHLSTMPFSKGTSKKWQCRFVLEARYCQKVTILWDKNGDMWSTKHSPYVVLVWVLYFLLSLHSNKLTSSNAPMHIKYLAKSCMM